MKINLEEIPNEKGIEPLHTDLINNAKNYQMETVNMSEYGIEAVEAGVDVITDFGLAGFEAYNNDGVINFKDAPLFFTPVINLGSVLFSGKVKYFGREVGDLDPIEREQLEAKWAAKMTTLSTEDAEISNSSFNVLLAIARLQQAIKAKKALETPPPAEG